MYVSVGFMLVSVSVKLSGVLSLVVNVNVVSSRLFPAMSFMLFDAVMVIVVFCGYGVDGSNVTVFVVGL